MKPLCYQPSKLFLVAIRFTGVIKSISELREGGVSVSITHDYGFYKSFSAAEHGEGYGRWDVFRKMCGWLGRVSEFLRKMCFRDESTQNGGAYIFRPTSDQSFEVIHLGWSLCMNPTSSQRFTRNLEIPHG